MGAAASLLLRKRPSNISAIFQEQKIKKLCRRVIEAFVASTAPREALRNGYIKVYSKE
tara:strand:- start:762 stop:935 length:174 start_codon:yes stop_codon:yes gene_type:complete